MEVPTQRDRTWRPHAGRRWFLRLLTAWMLAVPAVILVAVWNTPAHRAVLIMCWGVIGFWIGIGGGLMWWGRDRVRAWSARCSWPWGLQFVVGCTMLALVEEAVTTGMTNLAPWLGVPLGAAYITASANYLDVVLYHSVVVFVPMFIGWAVLLRWWRFAPGAVFVLFGITGTLAETLSFGPQNLINAGFWIWVYGLMVWLPAYCLPPRPNAQPPPLYAYPLAVVWPIAFLPLLAVLAPWLWLTAKHPPIHFPPMVP